MSHIDYINKQIHYQQSINTSNPRLFDLPFLNIEQYENILQKHPKLIDGIANMLSLVMAQKKYSTKINHIISINKTKNNEQ
ncbi:hypothetical protein [Xenorhabdus koppenhoeferi]|uniref:Uncharacterized protein n=1 Tax=Xenorhabdus koppenhoeferi TaxID=351659 RepID=A0A1I7JR48_9GAMM|nr:hypothetical protein [Xenorhabdus koppenhoeferi]CEE91459.1 hypothetical protein XNA1_2110003 [Xenorhabdus nematophila str. Anatoliense]SFU87657.1 hypothetical protein SAMN05421784_13730 [Xenorhabdus koppenhoeferi]